MNALVTGVAGFIGSHLAGRLLDEGASVTGLDCFTDYYPREVKETNLSGLMGRPGFRFIESTIQAADLDRLLGGTTHVFHLAAQAGVRKSWGRDFQIYTVNNIEATQVLLEAAVGKPLEKLVYASSSSVYGDDAQLPMREDAVPGPVSPYGVTKLAAEHLCLLYQHNFGVPAVALRYFTVYGPRQRPDMAFHRFLRAAMEGRPISVFGDGNQTRDFTYVGDAVTATAAAGRVGVPGRVYNIGGGSRASVNEVLAIVRRLASSDLDVRYQPVEKGDMRDTYADTSRARADLAFQPAHSLEDGLEAENQWLREAAQT
ncbi:MAG: NAD-dependent epimerase/dehydratase family protein [Acidobacteria bacterium]|nr:MAG: NAD-dependent epimerase/dehydratase family protein [Acidobacteriota bacterium]